MRLIIIAALVLGAFWVADRTFYKSRYSNEIWHNIKQESQKIESDIRRWTKF
jgi:hypothetical protein